MKRSVSETSFHQHPHHTPTETPTPCSPDSQQHPLPASPPPSLLRSRRFIAFAFAALSSIHRLRLRGCSSPPSLPRVGLPRCHLVASAVASSSPWPPSLAPLSTGSRRCRRCRFVPAAVVSSPPPSFHRRRRRFTINNQLITRGRGLSSEPSSHPSSRPSAT